MQLSPQKMFVPLFIVFSLTSGAVIILHYLSKKDEEDKKKRIKRKANQVSEELRIPHQKVPMIIGRGGLVLDSIQQNTDTNIIFEKESDVNLPDRLCIITGLPENIKLAKRKIQGILVNQPLIETYEVLVPVRTINKLLERGAELLHQIQNFSNAKIIVDQLAHPANSSTEEKRIIIKGTAEQIASALTTVEDRIREDKKAQNDVINDSLTRTPRIKTPPYTPKRDAVQNDTSSKEYFSDIEGLMEIYVTSVINPNQFYIQIINTSSDVLKKLVKDMSEYYEKDENQEVHVLKTIEVGQLVAAPFTMDSQWYRAEVMEIRDNDSYLVHYVDYGDQGVVEKKNIFELRMDFLSIKFQAIESSLAGIKPKDGEWSEKACEQFATLCSSNNLKILHAKIRRYKERIQDTTIHRREGSSIPCIELYEKLDNDKLKNIGQELVELGFAVSQDEPWSASNSSLSVRATASPEANLDRSNSSSSSTNGFVTVDHQDSASALTPEPKFPTEINNSPFGQKPALQFSTGSFLENERNQSFNAKENNYTASINKPLPPNPFLQESKNTYSKTSANIVPAGYEDTDDSDYDDYEGFDYSN